MDNLLLILGVALLAGLLVFLLLPRPDVEAELATFLTANVNREFALRLDKVQGASPYEDAAAKVYVAEILGSAGLKVADRGRFFRTRWEEEALIDLGLLKGLAFEKPEAARYALSVEVLGDLLKLTLADLVTGFTVTKTFPRSEKFSRLLQIVRGVPPRVISVNHSFERNDLVIRAVVNFPFVQRVSVSANNKTVGTYSVNADEFSFKIQNLRPGEVVDVSLTPLDVGGRQGQVFTRRFIAELPPEPVVSMSSSVSGGRITYAWTYPNPQYPDLRFEVSTALGNYTVTGTTLSEELRLGKLYNVRITAVGKYGRSETKSFVVKTPPSKPEVTASTSFDVIQLNIRNTCEYTVTYVINVDGKNFETSRNSFEYRVPTPGIPYRIEVRAVDGPNSSEPVVVTVQTKTPMGAPKVKAEIVGGATLLVTVDRITAPDFRSFSIVVNGREVSTSSQYSEAAKPDTIYDVRVRWFNTFGDASPEARAVVETFPLPPDVRWTQRGSDIVVEFIDPSKNVKAEAFEMIVEGRSYRTRTTQLTLEGFGNGKTYSAIVYAVKGDYKTPTRIVEMKTHSQPTQPPVIKNVFVQEGIVALEWTATKPVDFSHYIVVRRAGNDTKTVQTREEKLTDSPVPNGKLMNYTIRLVNAQGLESPPTHVEVKTFPEKPRVEVSYEIGKFTFRLTNTNEYEVEYRIERGGREVYRGKASTFTDTVDADGSLHTYRIYALTETAQSRPEERVLTAHSPLSAPSVNVSRAADSIVVTAQRPNVKDFREMYIEVDGTPFKTEVYSLRNEPDRIFYVKAYWVNTAGQKSAEATVTIQTVPRPPLVEHRYEAGKVTLRIADPSERLRAEKFVVSYAGQRIELPASGGIVEYTVPVDTNRSVHEFRIQSLRGETRSAETIVVVVIR